MENERWPDEWKQYIGICDENTVDEDDMEGEWEDVRELRQSNGRA